MEIRTIHNQPYKRGDYLLIGGIRYEIIEGKAELTITAEQALRVMKVMEAAFESAETGKTITTNI